ncbi:hypothetical protein [Thalassotalea marina]|uniref:Uncharacterized protein n=1 Tax=Thalassotalea marina TaxID=1673741 RepID=A0A919BJZ4_9GAMM|nr:hypothetical protein [Thalassotalea marina]GHF93722.1 hypothetical protein GCM10017161_22800 [Thalassotalea marina]
MKPLSSMSFQIGSHASKAVANLNKPDEQPKAVAEHSPVVSRITKVDISEEGLEKLAQEQKDLGRSLASQLNPEDEKQEGVSEPSNVEKLNQLIEEVQQKIKDLQQKISELDNDKSEQAETQRKALEAELMALNATLIGLISKKMEAIEEGNS